MRTKLAMLGIVSALVAVSLTSKLVASCLLATGSYCENGCNVLTFSSTGTNCTFTIERKSAGAESYGTLATNATSPYTDCPGSGCYMYRITATCSNCASASAEEGPLCCGGE